MSKDLLFNTPEHPEARNKIREGIRKLAAAVKITLGPTGRVVMFEREFGDPVITKDGVTVAKEVDLKDPFENMGAKMVRQATSKTAEKAGDGTTTATILTEAIFESGLKSITHGVNPQKLKLGITKAVDHIIDGLNKMAKPIHDLEQIKQVAICSSNQDQEIGAMIADAMDQVGKDGVITIEQGRSLKDRVDVVDGLQIPRGYATPQFSTDPVTQNAEYEDPIIVLTASPISHVQQLVALADVTATTEKPMIIVADEFDEKLLAIMAANQRENAIIKWVPIRAPGFGDRRVDTLEDLAIATGGSLVSNLTDAKEITKSLGSCKNVRVTRDETTFFEGGGDADALEARVQFLRDRLDNAAGDFDRERIQERIARLTGSIARIIVGGSTEVEVREKRDRVEDALHACKAAVSEGILPGGGVASIHVNKNLTDKDKDIQSGIDIIFNAVEAPLRQIAKNTSVDDGVVVKEVMDSESKTFGYNAATQQYGDMLEFGVIVPAKVEKTALQNAASVAGLLLTTDCVIAIDRNSDNSQQFESAAGLPPGLMPGMGGMPGM